MKKLFISQPMKGKSDEDILAERKKAIQSAEQKIGEPVEVIDSFFQEAPVDAKSRIPVPLSTVFRLLKTTPQSRKEVILLSPIHGLNGICPV